MAEQNRYLLVDAAVLPDVFLRVVKAKQLLALGKAKSFSEAAELVDISRSSFYKYKDSVFPYEAVVSNQIANLSLELEDRAGVLSSVLSAVSGRGANILTINQNIPVDGVAPVSISMRIDRLKGAVEALIQELQELDGVVNLRLLTN